MRIILITIFALFALCATAETIRIGTWNTELSRDGPGLLIKDMLEDEKVTDWVKPVRALDLDFLLLVDVDQDYEARAAKELAARLGFAHFHMDQTNRGLPTGLDVNGDNWFDEDDQHGFGRFHGQHSMLLLAQSPPESTQSFNTLKWRDFAENPSFDGENYYTDEAWEVLRLSPTGLWDADFGDFHVLSAYASTPAFDGNEQRNVLRNATEINWWTRYISGEAFENDADEMSQLDAPFILLGTLNLDPEKGKGKREAVRALLARPELNPVEFKNRNTVDWSAHGLGEMRVDYILPSCHFEVIKSGQVELNSPHRLIWVELKQIERCE